MLILETTSSSGNKTYFGGFPEMGVIEQARTLKGLALKLRRHAPGDRMRAVLTPAFEVYKLQYDNQHNSLRLLELVKLTEDQLRGLREGFWIY